VKLTHIEPMATEAATVAAIRQLETRLTNAVWVMQSPKAAALTSTMVDRQIREAHLCLSIDILIGHHAHARHSHFAAWPPEPVDAYLPPDNALTSRY